MRQHQRSRSNNEKPEEAQAIRETTTKHRSRDEMQQRENDDLLIVSGSSPSREPYDLKERGKLHHHVDDGLACNDPSRLYDEEENDAGRCDMTKERMRLPRFRYRERRREAYEERDGGPRAQSRCAHDGKNAQHRKGIGHDSVDEAEAHSRHRFWRGYFRRRRLRIEEREESQNGIGSR